MSLLAQLHHDPPALDLGDADHVLHLFQCQECFGYDSGKGNDAVMIPVDHLGDGLTNLPANEDLGGILGSDLDRLVGELWIEGWKAVDDGLDPRLADEVFEQDRWMQLPETVTCSMFECHWRTKAGGVPYWTGNGPQHEPRPGYEFLFQLDDAIEFIGTPPRPDDVGGMVVVTRLQGQGKELRIVEQICEEPKPANKKLNAPWSVDIDVSAQEKFLVGITNLGTDGTAYVFINRECAPADVYWFWTR